VNKQVTVSTTRIHGFELFYQLLQQLQTDEISASTTAVIGWQSTASPYQQPAQPLKPPTALITLARYVSGRTLSYAGRLAFSAMYDDRPISAGISQRYLDCPPQHPPSHASLSSIAEEWRSARFISVSREIENENAGSLALWQPTVTPTSSMHLLRQ